MRDKQVQGSIARSGRLKAGTRAGGTQTMQHAQYTGLIMQKERTAFQAGQFVAFVQSCRKNAKPLDKTGWHRLAHQWLRRIWLPAGMYIGQHKRALILAELIQRVFHAALRVKRLVG